MINTTLSSEQISAFNRDGFLHVPAFFTQREITEISTWTDELSLAPEMIGKDWKYFEESALDRTRILCRIENFAPVHQHFDALMRGGPMQTAVSDLFGEEAVLFKDKINFKMPGGNGFSAHQDVQAGWDAYAPLHITAMISIDATTAENGSLEMLPGQHDKGLIGKKWEPLTEVDTKHAPYVPVHCNSGDAVFFDSYAPHKSGPNSTDSARRVLYVTYNANSSGDHRVRYYEDKHKSYPPDIERDHAKDYSYKV